MSATVRYEPVAYCADCNDGCGWDNDEISPDDWSKQHNAEYHEGATP